MVKKLKSFGLTEDDYRDRLQAQGWACAICGGPPEKERGLFDLDHDHNTEEARGLLCGACNRGLGQFGDSQERLMAAWYYLEQWGGEHP